MVSVFFLLIFVFPVLHVEVADLFGAPHAYQPFWSTHLPTYSGLMPDIADLFGIGNLFGSLISRPIRDRCPTLLTYSASDTAKQSRGSVLRMPLFATRQRFSSRVPHHPLAQIALLNGLGCRVCSDIASLFSVGFAKHHPSRCRIRCETALTWLNEFHPFDIRSPIGGLLAWCQHATLLLARRREARSVRSQTYSANER